VKIKAGEKLDLAALLRVEPKDAAPNLTWESKKPKIAKVNKAGVLKALKKGRVKITVEDKVTGLKATITVIVK